MFRPEGRRPDNRRARRIAAGEPRGARISGAESGRPRGGRRGHDGGVAGTAGDRSTRTCAGPRGRHGRITAAGGRDPIRGWHAQAEWVTVVSPSLREMRNPAADRLLT